MAENDWRTKQHRIENNRRRQQRERFIFKINWSNFWKQKILLISVKRLKGCGCQPPRFLNGAPVVASGVHRRHKASGAGGGISTWVDYMVTHGLWTHVGARGRRVLGVLGARTQLREMHPRHVACPLPKKQRPAIINRLIRSL